MNFSGPAYVTADAVALAGHPHATVPMERLVSVDAARHRVADQPSAAALQVFPGPRRTVLLQAAGRVLGLVQPWHRDENALRQATRAAKEDLVWAIAQAGDDEYLQGIVYLPHYSKVTRSAAGAMEMARMRVHYEIAPPDADGLDQLDHAVGFLREAMREDDEALARMAACGDELRRRYGN